MNWVLRFLVREAMEVLLRKALAAVVCGAAANLLPRMAVSRI